MNITLSPETESVIRQKVGAGKFASADEVVEAAVKLLDTRDRYCYLRNLLLEAEQQIRKGEVVEWTPELDRQLQIEVEPSTFFANNLDLAEGVMRSAPDYEATMCNDMRSTSFIEDDSLVVQRILHQRMDATPEHLA